MINPMTQVGWITKVGQLMEKVGSVSYLK
ncbi:uncharacterized protein METZ01_LOCUS353053 [marine metagenome]|uniref:Uncharacterized protein n=1 Tax=marine metagenome TaxID=408172 RepID=A0A382RR91_9ZZZZ